MTRIRAFLQGISEGWRAPHCLSVGYTWGDRRDVAYDRGVNVGQRLRAPFAHEKPR